MGDKKKADKKDYLPEEKVRELLSAAKAGNNDAWNRLVENYNDYIYKMINKYTAAMNSEKPLSPEDWEDLFQAGRVGLFSALRNYDEGKKVKFTTFAYKGIRGEICQECKRIRGFLSYASLDAMQEEGMEAIAKILETGEEEFDKDFLDESGLPDQEKEPENLGKYSDARSILQMEYLIKRMTDENHTLSFTQLKNLLRFYRAKKYHNASKPEADNTLKTELAELMLESNPYTFNGENDSAFRIKYKGYRENILKNKKDLMDPEHPVRVKSGKAPALKEIQFVHDFTNEERDELIQVICFSDLISAQEKTKLVGKLVNTASAYYTSPFYDRGLMKFNPSGIHGRFSGRKLKDRTRLYENIRVIQEAIRNGAQIQFCFNQYNEEHQLIPRNNYLHILSPYHIVVYHDNFFCIGLRQASDEYTDERIWHYRVDLMSDLQIRRDAKGKMILIKIAEFEGTPICNAAWNPEKYLSEHINMGYDEPKEFRIKIPKDCYTILQDWFGDYYEKCREVCEKEYDIVKVKSAPFMIVKWALQYGDYVELMDDDAREMVKEELRKMGEKYGG